MYFICICLYLQTSGVFSQGATDTQSGRRSKGQGGDRYSDSDRKVFIEKPKLNLDRDIDKDEEERKLKALLKDDFIDDNTEPDAENAPVILPMILEGMILLI